MSARSSAVGPAPFFRTPTTPVVPTPVVVSNPSAVKCLSTRLDVSLLVKPQFRMAVEVLVQVDQIQIHGDRFVH